MEAFERALLAKSAFMPAFTATFLAGRASRLGRRNANTLLAGLEIPTVGVKCTAGKNQGSGGTAGHVPFARATVDNLRESTISRPSVSKEVFIRNVTNCSIEFGPCSGAAFIENAADSRIKLAAHQIRLSRCQNLELHAHVETNVTMEECCNVRVHPLESWYDAMPEHMVEAGLTGANRWQDIVDFTNL